MGQSTDERGTGEAISKYFAFQAAMSAFDHSPVEQGILLVLGRENGFASEDLVTQVRSKDGADVEGTFDTKAYSGISFHTLCNPGGISDFDLRKEVLAADDLGALQERVISSGYRFGHSSVSQAATRMWEGGLVYRGYESRTPLFLLSPPGGEAYRKVAGVISEFFGRSYETEGSKKEHLLSMPISELDLSVRADNCLDSAKIFTIGELVDRPAHELLRLRSFGRTTLTEVCRKLSERGLCLSDG